MSTYANTVPVMERHRFDAASLDRYLRQHLEGYRGGLEVRQFDSGHSNPTFFVSAEMADGKSHDFVLRKKPPGKLVASAHKVDPAKVGLGDYGRSGQYIARQVARWSKQYAELKTEDIPAMDKLSAWLPE